MEGKKSNRVRKTLAILLVFCFILSITVASANTAANNKGYSDGYNKGYSDGKKQGKTDCVKHGSKENLSKVPLPASKVSWTKSYKDSFNEGYKKGYIDGYNGNRYSCLK